MSLHIGKALNLNDLEEGDDVYFECSIQVIVGDNFSALVFVIAIELKKGGNVYFKQSYSCKSTNYVFVKEMTTINT